MATWRSKANYQTRLEYHRSYNKSRRNAERYRQALRRRRGLPEPTRAAPKLCECCGRPPNLKKKALGLDHDHTTGKFRGWICAACNLGLGMLGDNLRGVRRAMRYLERAR